jgi:hypothetical protein
MIHCAEPGQIFESWPNPYGAQLYPGSITEQLRQQANRPCGIAPGRKMPESLAGARVEATLLRRRNKTRDGALVRGSKEEGLVKSTPARKLGISRL